MQLLFTAIKTKLNTVGDIAHEQTIIYRELFAGHLVGSGPAKRRKMIMIIFVVVIIIICDGQEALIAVNIE